MTNNAAAAIRFVLDGQVVTVTDAKPTTTLLDYLREQGRCGAKEGCAEGDCGACTVVLGELNGEHIDYRAVNSCIRFLPTVAGKALVTVESLQAADGTLHPVQQAMVDCHASQCGFCTPGFVMSLFALYLRNAAPTRETVVEALAGNLCRCTGYRPIIDAGCKASQYAEPSHWSRVAAQAPALITALRAVQNDEAAALPGFQAPRSIEALATAYAATPNALLLAGGTDIGLWVTKQLRELPPIIYLGDIAELKTISDDAEALTIGAAASLTDAWAALIAHYPSLAEVAQRFASPPVRNSGTLGGNVANGSPIGDSMPPLLALDAEVLLRCGARTRRLPLHAFYLGYQQKDLAPGEFVVGIRIPHAAADTKFACYKLSKRIDQDISAVCAAFALRIVDGVIVDAKLAFGGMAAVPARAAQAEAALIGHAWTEAAFTRAAAALAADFQPLSDLRASSAYRLRAAGNLLQRFYREHSDAAPGLPPPVLRTHAVAVP